MKRVAVRLARLDTHLQAAWIVAVLLFLCTDPAFTAPATTLAEPNAEAASGWRPDMENTWASIGWKDHPLRFNM